MTQKPFTAFPDQGLQFLRSLKRHNNREWFQRHKSIYEQYVKQPMTDLITALAQEFQQFAPEMLASPRTSAYRIHRDTRFSKNKSPYKTHVAAVFPRSGLGKHEGAAFYLHIAP
ncbi:MAG: TIGR02453 family protein, partial [Acidobacteria bacterium]